MANDIGIHSVGINPSGSTIPCFAVAGVSLRGSIMAIASEPMFATYSLLPSLLTASASGSAPK